MRRAVIDIGSSSVLLLIATVSDSGKIAVLRDEARITRLGTRRISEQASQQTIDVVLEYTKICRELPVEAVDVIGTEVFRSAENAGDIQEKIRKFTGHTVFVISGEEEAAYSFQSALPSDAADEALFIVIDIGGGSTEIMAGSRRAKQFSQSLALGALSLTERHPGHDPPTAKELDAIHCEIRDRIGTLRLGTDIKGTAIGIGGTITTLAAVKLRLAQFDPAKIEGCNLTESEINSVLNQFTTRSAHNRLSLPGMQQGREDIIIAGTAILLGFMNHFGLSIISVSTRGARYGYLLSKIRPS